MKPWSYIWLEFGLFSTIIAIICACACWALFEVALTNTVHLIYIYINIYIFKHILSVVFIKCVNPNWLFRLVIGQAAPNGYCSSRSMTHTHIYMNIYIYIYIYITAGRYNLKTIGGGYYGHGSGVWLGATDEAVEGSFVWLPTGTPMIFNGWDYNEPNGHGQQNCAAYLHGHKKWHDVTCGDSFEVCICEGWWRPYMLLTNIFTI